MMTIAGATLIAIGLLAGVFLVLAPFGVTGADPGLVTWGMFPVLSTLGYVFIATGTTGPNIALLSRVMGGITLLLGLGAIVTLFAADNGLVSAHSSLAPLWYVLGFGIVFGAAGIGVGKRVQQEAAAAQK